MVFQVELSIAGVCKEVLAQGVSHSKQLIIKRWSRHLFTLTITLHPLQFCNILASMFHAKPSCAHYAKLSICPVVGQYDGSEFRVQSEEDQN